MRGPVDRLWSFSSSVVVFLPRLPRPRRLLWLPQPLRPTRQHERRHGLHGQPNGAARAQRPRRPGQPDRRDA